MVDSVGLAGCDGKGVEFAVEGLGNEGQIVFVADDLGDFEIGFVEVLRGFRKIDAAASCGSQIV